MEDESVLGIENIKKAALAAINFAEAIEAKNDDGKVTLIEALTAGVGSFGDIVSVIKSAKDIKAEYVDLSSDEKSELLAYIKLELDLADDKTEATVEAALEMVFNLSTIIELIKN